jgi:cell division protein FtsB
VLVVNALAGERGYIETMRAKQQYQDLADSIRDLRKENVELREQARKLKEDPKTIEDLARMELGFIKPDEILFIIRDMPPIDDLPSVPKTPPIP